MVSAECAFLVLLYAALLIASCGEALGPMEVPRWYHLSPEARIFLSIGVCIFIVAVGLSLLSGPPMSPSPSTADTPTTRSKRAVTSDDLSVHSWVTQDLTFD